MTVMAKKYVIFAMDGYDTIISGYRKTLRKAE
jgi:hypothetical protein